MKKRTVTLIFGLITMASAVGLGHPRARTLQTCRSERCRCLLLFAIQTWTIRSCSGQSAGPSFEKDGAECIDCGRQNTTGDDSSNY